MGYWLISDLIPKKSEKYEFCKNLVIMFLSVENWPENEILQFFAHAIFEKGFQNFVFRLSFQRLKRW